LKLVLPRTRAGEVNMRKLAEGCAAMAAAMLDAELLAIARRTNDLDTATPLQKAVVRELRKRSPGLMNMASGSHA